MIMQCKPLESGAPKFCQSQVSIGQSSVDVLRKANVEGSPTGPPQFIELHATSCNHVDAETARVVRAKLPVLDEILAYLRTRITTSSGGSNDQTALSSS